METIYLSLRAQVAVGTFFMKSPVAQAVAVFISVHKYSDKSWLSRMVTLLLHIQASVVGTWPSGLRGRGRRGRRGRGSGRRQQGQQELINIVVTLSIQPCLEKGSDQMIVYREIDG